MDLDENLISLEEEVRELAGSEARRLSFEQEENNSVTLATEVFVLRQRSAAHVDLKHPCQEKNCGSYLIPKGGRESKSKEKG